MNMWYLLYCKHQNEKRAYNNLVQQNYEVYYPIIPSRNNNCVARTVPLFPRYIFIKLDPMVNNFNSVRSTRGIYHFVHFGPKLGVVPSALIAKIKQKVIETSHAQCERFKL